MMLARKAKNSEDMGRLLSENPIIPVLTIRDVEHAVPLAEALVNGGLKMLEVTLRTPCALEAIRKINEDVPDAIIGGGTIITDEHLDQLVAAGGEFAVSPGINRKLLEKARDMSLPYLPGVVSASEVMIGLYCGYEVFKFFPAEASGGVRALKSLSGPFTQAKFCPTGGVGAENFKNYLSLPNIISVAGSWVAPSEAVEAENWAAIESLARQALDLI